MASVALYHEMGNTWEMALSLTGSACVAVEAEPGPDGARRAARLLGAAEAKRESIGARPSHLHDFEIRQTCALASEDLDRTEFAAAWVEGRELNSDQVAWPGTERGCPIKAVDEHRDRFAPDQSGLAVLSFMPGSQGAALWYSQAIP